MALFDFKMRYVLFLLSLFLLAGCNKSNTGVAGVYVDENYFESRNPFIKLEIDKSIEYTGSFKSKSFVNIVDSTYQRRGGSDLKFSIFAKKDYMSIADEAVIIMSEKIDPDLIFIVNKERKDEISHYDEEINNDIWHMNEMVIGNDFFDINFKNKSRQVCSIMFGRHYFAKLARRRTNENVVLNILYIKRMSPGEYKYSKSYNRDEEFNKKMHHVSEEMRKKITFIG